MPPATNGTTNTARGIDGELVPDSAEVVVAAGAEEHLWPLQMLGNGKLPDGPGPPEPCGVGLGVGVARFWPQSGGQCPTPGTVVIPYR